jgi:hypothetical protein
VAAIFVNGLGRNEQSYRGPPIDASYQVSVHLAKRFQRRRFFRNHPIRNKNCLWWPYLLTDRDEMSNHNRGLSIDTSYQVLVHLAKRFQRRTKFLLKTYGCHPTWPSLLQKNRKLLSKIRLSSVCKLLSRLVH